MSGSNSQIAAAEAGVYRVEVTVPSGVSRLVDFPREQQDGVGQRRDEVAQEADRGSGWEVSLRVGRQQPGENRKCVCTVPRSSIQSVLDLALDGSHDTKPTDEPPREEPLGAREAITRVDGLTDAEGVVHDHLIEAVQAWWRLDRQHPDENRDFCDGIHKCQDQLALRIVRRAYPVGWPNKGAERPRVR